MNIIYETKKELMKEPNRDIGKNSVYYVYHLIDPITNSPFYVGKGKKWRLYRHESNVIHGRLPNGVNRRLFKTIKNILNNKLRVKYIKIKENLSNEESKVVEIEEIKKLTDNGIILCNGTKGGDDRPSTEEIGRRHSIIMMGHKVSEETKKKMSENWSRNRTEKYFQQAKDKSYKCGFNKFWCGKKRSEESKKKYSQSKLGNKNAIKLIDNIMFDFIYNLYKNNISLQMIRQKLNEKFNILLSIGRIVKELKYKGVYE